MNESEKSSTPPTWLSVVDGLTERAREIMRKEEQAPENDSNTYLMRGHYTGIVEALCYISCELADTRLHDMAFAGVLEDEEWL